MNRYLVRLEITVMGDAPGRALARCVELLPRIARKLHLFSVVAGVAPDRRPFHGLIAPDPADLVDRGALWRCSFDVDQVAD